MNTQPRKHKNANTFPNRWPLQSAKARLSEVIRTAKECGPQVVTLHGREEAVVMSSEDYVRMAGRRTGQDLIDCLQNSPHREIDIEPERYAMPVREIEL